MTVAGLSGDEDALARERSWRPRLLSDLEEGRRNRRPADAGVVLTAAIFAGLTAVIARSAPTDDVDIARALVTMFGWAEALWRAAFVGVLVLAAVIVVDLGVRRRWDLARDVGSA